MCSGVPLATLNHFLTSFGDVEYLHSMSPVLSEMVLLLNFIALNFSLKRDDHMMQQLIIIACFKN